MGQPAFTASCAAQPGVGCLEAGATGEAAEVEDGRTYQKPSDAGPSIHTPKSLKTSQLVWYRRLSPPMVDRPYEARRTAPRTHRSFIWSIGGPFIGPFIIGPFIIGPFIWSTGPFEPKVESEHVRVACVKRTLHHA